MVIRTMNMLSSEYWLHHTMTDRQIMTIWHLSLGKQGLDVQDR